MMPYASRTGTRRNLDALRRAGWGLLISAEGVQRDEGFEPIALDNGAWTAHQQQRPWDEGKFRALLDKFDDRAAWVAAPDIVEGGAASLQRSVAWLPELLSRCRRVLIPVQDGLRPDDLRPHMAARVGLFIGGSTPWKLASLPEWGRFADEVGCYLHVGRVNTQRRIALCASAGADSFDGTSASRFAVTIPRLDAARKQQAWPF